LTDGVASFSLARAGDTLQAALDIESVYFRGRFEDYGPDAVELSRYTGRIRLMVVSLSQDGRRLVARDEASRVTLDADVSADRRRLSGRVSIGTQAYDLRMQRK
jgi:hypothetical protein